VSAPLKTPKNPDISCKTNIDNRLAARGKKPALSTLSTARIYQRSLNTVSTLVINDLQIVFRLGCA
jgi:hypothetical protein